MGARSALLGVALGLTGAMLAGCASPPKGCDGGRVPVDTTTKGERGDPRPSGDGIIAASDAIAQALAMDISRITEEDFKGYRVTMILGDISNKTAVVPTSDFELMQTRIKDKLLHSGLFRDNVQVVERRGRMARLNNEEIGEAPEDIIQTDAAQPAPARNPQYTLYLLGDTYGVHRESTHMYYLAFKLTRASDGAELFSKSYEVKYDVGKRHH